MAQPDDQPGHGQQERARTCGRIAHVVLSPSREGREREVRGGGGKGGERETVGGDWARLTAAE